jgi:hypothetical protein
MDRKLFLKQGVELWSHNTLAVNEAHSTKFTTISEAYCLGNSAIYIKKI